VGIVLNQSFCFSTTDLRIKRIDPSSIPWFETGRFIPILIDKQFLSLLSNGFGSIRLIRKSVVLTVAPQALPR
jgi:hypothetical protein